jgi:TonB-dependent starch-binding outer membrane protein SusC
MRKLQVLLGATLLCCAQLSAQQKTITGLVTDASGMPIPNASVIIKEGNFGTSTNFDGSYTITLPAKAKSLVISAIGMSSVTVAINDKKGVMDINMEDAERAMSTAVATSTVTATPRKRNTSIASVKMR